MAKKQSSSKALATWDEELAKAAMEAANAEANSGGGQFFSTKSGVLAWQDAPLPGNEMAVIIVDTIFENVRYDGQYDPDVPQAPVCFAFNHVEKDLAPHESVVEFGTAQHPQCQGCEWNEFGTADVGKGKGCRNTRRLAMIPAGQFDRQGTLELIEEPDHYETTTMGFMKLPVTSVKGYASFVKQVAGALKRPPYGIVTRVSVVPDSKTQFKVVFEPLMKVPDKLIGTIMQRVEEAKATIDFPYQLEVEEAPPPRGRTAKKPAAGKTATRSRRKY